MPTHLSKMTTAGLTAIQATTVAELKPYQVDQIQDVLNRLKWDRGSNSDVSVQPTIATILTALGTNEP